MELNQSVLKCGMTEEYIGDICRKAADKGLSSVSVFPSVVAVAAKALKGTDTKCCSSVSYPLGADLPKIKVNEAKLVIGDGAQEVCMVMNAAAVKVGDLGVVKEEVKGVVDAAHAAGCRAKVMIETVLLTKEQVKTAVELADSLGADVILPSTGFKPLQARKVTAEDIAYIAGLVKNAEIEAAGTIEDRQTAEALVSAGAKGVAADAALDF